MRNGAFKKSIIIACKAMGRITTQKSTSKMNSDEYVLIRRNVLDKMLDQLSKADESFSITAPASEVYSNKQMMELLHINDKLIRKYREKGLIGYTRVGDKYWYSRKDVEAFLNNNHFQAFE